MDIFAHEDDEFLALHGMPKNSMTLVDAERSAFLYGSMRPVAKMSGGSVANTVVCAAGLGSAAAFVGKVAADEFGIAFTADLRAAGVDFGAEVSSGLTGTACSLIVVTPDGHRTMNTYLGACVELTAADVDTELVSRARVTCVEGYLFDSPPAKEAVLLAARTARAAGHRVALTLSDSYCVERHREEFRDFIEEHVDLVFGNEAEVVSLCETDGLPAALSALAERDLIAAVTRGAHGSVVLESGRAVEVPAETVARIVDTTGAGDAYAAGFLHGLARGLDLPSCARTGSAAAAEVIGHLGSRPQADLLLDEA
ncbi:adenosine kinase [Actinomadura macrotermitis]|uniref:adenosine kinase n=1 Tax=Actinomadura macrotermitis TaxID=2585200 RepID=UPI001A9B7DDF|nr:adenosine kinase [Actinomadura macrotermitis]